jgi:hypothetical protein
LIGSTAELLIQVTACTSDFVVTRLDFSLHLATIAQIESLVRSANFTRADLRVTIGTNPRSHALIGADVGINAGTTFELTTITAIGTCLSIDA